MIRILCASLTVYTRYRRLSMLHTPIFSNEAYEVYTVTTHRFPMIKYRVVREQLKKEYSQHKNVSFPISPTISRNELVLTHCSNYVDRYLSGQLSAQEIRKIGFPWSEAHVYRTLCIVGGTVAATRAILETPITSSSSSSVSPSTASSRMSQVACNIAGGQHHAFYNYGEGFCIFSDIAVAINIAFDEYPEQVKRVMIIDLDVHQGNGNAVLFQQDTRVFTFSMHCSNNIFSKKQISDLDIELPAGCPDDEYLSKLKEILPSILDYHQPDLVFYQAGVDIHQYDGLGKLSITRQGISQRNHIVYQAIKDRQLKLVVTMGGGYPKNTDPTSLYFQEIMETHTDVYRDCIKVFYDI